MHHTTRPLHHAALRRALAEEVADVDPQPRIDEVLDATGQRTPWWAVALVVTIGVLGGLLLAAGLVLLAAEPEREPAPSLSPTSLLEA